jgi:hypothetical protein
MRKHWECVPTRTLLPSQATKNKMKTAVHRRFGHGKENTQTPTTTSKTESLNRGCETHSQNCITDRMNDEHMVTTCTLNLVPIDVAAGIALFHFALKTSMHALVQQSTTIEIVRGKHRRA